MRGRSPALLGTIGIAAMAAVLLVVLIAPKAWYLARTHSYSAEFANAAGLSDADPVYLAGVPAGRVDSVELAGDHVLVRFRLDRAQPLGDRTTAAVKLRTILGKRYLDVTPAGSGAVGRADTIPLARTSVPYSLDEIGAATDDVATGLDVPALETMVQTLRETIPTDTALVHDAVTGVASASQLLTRNDEQIARLLDTSQSLTGVVAAQSDSITTVVDNAQTVLGILADRRTALGALITDLQSLIDDASRFLADAPELDPLVANLRSVADTLSRNTGNIDAVFTTLPAGLRAVTNATGNGNWVDVSAPAGPLPDNLLCALGVMTGCR